MGSSGWAPSGLGLSVSGAGELLSVGEVLGCEGVEVFRVLGCWGIGVGTITSGGLECVVETRGEDGAEARCEASSLRWACGEVGGEGEVRGEGGGGGKGGSRCGGEGGSGVGGEGEGEAR